MITQNKFIIETSEYYPIDLLKSKIGLNNNDEVKCIFKELNIYSIKSGIENKKMYELLDNSDIVTNFGTDSKIEYRETPNDLYYSNQYYMDLISAPETWNYNTGGLSYDGDTIVVAVLDKGIEISHPDLIDNMWKNRFEIPGDNIDNDNNGYVDDYDGLDLRNDDGNIYSAAHGTGVSGIIGASGNNSRGISGVNWNVKILPITSIGLKSDLIQAYNYIIDFRDKYNKTNGAEGAFIVCSNLSAGFSGEFVTDGTNLIFCNIYDKLGEVGILNVSAADNIGENMDEVGDIPTLCPSDYLIPVTSVDANDDYDVYRGYSNISVDIAAPGEDIYTTTVDDSYTYSSGNSEAAPMVAGAIALFYTVPCSGFIEKVKLNPSELSLNIKDYMMEYSDKHSDLTERTVSGGRLNINATYAKLSDFCGEIEYGKLEIIKITPNPATDNIEVYYNFAKTDKHNISIFNTSGQLIYTKDFYPNIFGDKILDIDISYFPKATYYAKLTDGENNVSKAFVAFRK
ncbi:MAG: S8 family serine peptidase [Saprospiraceae bacterium]